MAKNKVHVDVVIDDKGTLKQAAAGAKQAGQEIDKTAQKGDKYHKGQKGVAQATANSTKAFSKMQGGMTGMVGVYAEIASRVFALTAAFQFLKDASDVTNLIAGQEAMGQVTGVAYKTMTADLKAATDGQLAYADAAKAAAIGTAAGLSAGQLEEIGKAAKNASNALGRDLKDSFDRLVRGITKAEPELLDELGIILRLETAKKNYASQIGKTAGSLSQFEASQAVANEVLSQAEEKFGAIEDLMPKNAASLNKFLVSFDNLMNSLKQGSMSVLRPVFDFLSNNTIALVSSLGFIGVSILKSILPNMDEWRKSSLKTLAVANKGLEGYKKNLVTSGEALKKFNLQQETSKENAVALAEGAMGPKGFGTVTKSGGGAMDFLSGQSDSKRSRKNAKRVLDNAQKDIDKFGKVTTGMLKGYNAKQVADLRMSYKMREAVINKQEVKHKLTLKKMGMHWDVWKAKANVAISAVQTRLAAFGAWASKWGSRLMGALGWLGMIGMAVGAIKSLIAANLPDYIKKSQAASKELTESMKTLNEELVKFVQFSESGALGGAGIAVQIGNAASSSSMATRIQKLYNGSIRAGSKEFKTAKNAIEANFKELRKLHPEYERFAQLFKDGKLTGMGENSKELKAFEDELAQIANYTKNAGKAAQQTTDAFTKLAGSVKPTNPLSTALIALRSQIEGLGGATSVDKETGVESIIKGKLQGMEQSISEEGKLGAKALEKANADIEKAQNLSTKKGRTRGGQRGISDEEKQARIKAAKDRRDLLQTQQDETVEGIQKTKEEIEQLKVLSGIAEKYGKDLENNAKVRTANESKITDLLNAGVTFEDRRNKLKIAAIKDDQKRLDLEDKITLALAAQKAVEASTAEDKEAQLKAAGLAVEAAKQALAKEERQKQINDEIRKGKKEQLDLEERLLGIAKKRAAEELKLLQAQRVSKFNASGVATFGLEQASVGRTLKTQELLTKEKIAQAKADAAVEKANSTAGLKPEEIQNRRIAAELAKEQLRSAQQELYLHQQMATTLENRLRAATQKLQYDQMNVGMNSMQAQFNAEVYKYLQQGIPLREINQDLIKEELAKQKEISQELELQNTTRDAIKSGMSSSLSALIKGEESSLKDAIGQMAQDALGTIADKLAEQMTDNILDSIFNVEEVTLPLQIQTAHGTGATAIGTAITTSLEVGAVTLSTAIATALAGGAAVGSSIAGKNLGLGGTEKKIGQIETKVPTFEQESEFIPGGNGEINEVTVYGKKGESSFFDDIFADMGDMFSGLKDSLGGIFKGIGGGLMDILGGIGGGFMSLFGFASGGIMDHGKKIAGYSTGGIAKGSKRGYPAILHGTEAVVPLPNGKSIPVQMENNRSNTMNTNNVTVNVSAEGNTSTQADGRGDIDTSKLGEQVAMAVQKELQNQKRSGGILNPYGAA